MHDNMNPCHHTVSEDAVYKEVVVIGNGPSGLVTSFMLAGNVPYLKPVPEDLPIDEMFRTRLSNVPKEQSLYDADLMQLAEGLEGRSQNPMPLLMDTLLRPCTDLGIEADSLIEWKHDVDKQIDHIVLGRGPPGGAWQSFPPSVRSLSPASWLSLPPLPAAPAQRLLAREVADYCRRYVKHCHLQRYFRSDVIVSSVTLAPRPAELCDSYSCPLNARWSVSGYDKAQGGRFRYVCKRLVLAAGAADRPNSLPARAARGGLLQLRDVTRALAALAGSPTPPTVLVVGSGVSAADALSLARGAGARAAHLHRDPAPALRALPGGLFPEYYEVYRLMCEGPSEHDKNYIPYPEHIIVEVNLIEPSSGKTDEATCPKRVKLLNVVTNEIVELVVDVLAILIGSKPDLFFLQTNFDINTIDAKDCKKCLKESNRRKHEENQCSLKNHWHYLKSVVGQSIQNCRSRLASEINGNNDTKCNVEDCNSNECSCLDKENVAADRCRCRVIPYSNRVRTRSDCSCKQENPFSAGIGFGLDPTKPVDSRSNPVAVDKSTHEVLNAPKGMFAIGPLTADNFVRFIPGGALAAVAQIHKYRKECAE